jgi:hypothetical protein
MYTGKKIETIILWLFVSVEKLIKDGERFVEE